MRSVNTLSDAGKVLLSACRALNRAVPPANFLPEDEVNAQMVIAQQHAIESIIFEQWRIDGQTLSSDQSHLVANQQQKSIQRAALMLMFGRAILQLLNAEKVRAIIYKGLPLSKHLFGRHDARFTGDIDLLIDSKDLPNAARLLRELGFNCVVDTQWLTQPSFIHNFYEVEFRSIDPAIEIDVHWQLAPRWIAHPSQCQRLLRSEAAIEIGGHTWPWIDPAEVWFVQSVELMKSDWIEFKSVVSFVHAWDVVVANDMIGEAAKAIALFSVEQQACLRSLLSDTFDRQVWNFEDTIATARIQTGVRLARKIERLLLAGETGIAGALGKKAVQLSKYAHHLSPAASVFFDRMTTPHYDDLAKVSPVANRASLLVAKSKRILGVS
jgi:Uncharacterised nucleotidyltransferase